MTDRIGFMQGRLSPLVDGRIQAFPWTCWRDEFPAAQQAGIRLMEWTLDQDRLYENPLLTRSGQNEIRSLCSAHDLRIPSLTGDCFMQAPFWRVSGAQRDALHKDFLAIAEACAAVGIKFIVVPLVDNGRLDNRQQEDELVSFLKTQTGFFKQRGLKVVFESDFAAADFARFIDRLDGSCFGVNYDIGNSAALGFDPKEEFAAYGYRVLNVHVKDRLLGGTTVPLGTGSAKFDQVFSALAAVGYQGNYILQTARATGNDHASVLSRYRDMTTAWIAQYGA